MTNQELLEQLIVVATRQYVALSMALGNEANARHDEAQRITDELQRRGGAALDGVVELFSHAEPAVRLWAAVVLAEHRKDGARAVVRSLVENERGAVALHARLLQQRRGWGP